MDVAWLAFAGGGCGMLHLLYPYWPKLGLGLGWLTLAPVAIAHTAAAFAMLVFFIVHVYLAFSGKPFYSYVHAMISGYEELDDDTLS